VLEESYFPVAGRSSADSTSINRGSRRHRADRASHRRAGRDDKACRPSRTTRGGRCHGQFSPRHDRPPARRLTAVYVKVRSGPSQCDISYVVNRRRDYLTSTSLSLRSLTVLLRSSADKISQLTVSPAAATLFKARGYAYAKIEYVSIRTFLSKNRIRI